MERCRLWSVGQCFHGKGHFKKLTLFATSPIASKYSAFPLTEVSASKAIFPSDYPLIVFNAFILEFGACLTQNGMAQEQP